MTVLEEKDINMVNESELDSRPVLFFDIDNCVRVDR